jgi:hypothetical protein
MDNYRGRLTLPTRTGNDFSNGFVTLSISQKLLTNAENANHNRNKRVSAFSLRLAVDIPA